MRFYESKIALLEKHASVIEELENNSWLELNVVARYLLTESKESRRVMRAHKTGKMLTQIQREEQHCNHEASATVAPLPSLLSFASATSQDARINVAFVSLDGSATNTSFPLSQPARAVYSTVFNKHIAENPMTSADQCRLFVKEGRDLQEDWPRAGPIPIHFKKDLVELPVEAMFH